MLTQETPFSRVFHLATSTQPHAHPCCSYRFCDTPGDELSRGKKHSNRYLNDMVGELRILYLNVRVMIFCRRFRLIYISPAILVQFICAVISFFPSFLDFPVRPPSTRRHRWQALRFRPGIWNNGNIITHLFVSVAGIARNKLYYYLTFPPDAAVLATSKTISTVF